MRYNSQRVCCQRQIFYAHLTLILLLTFFSQLPYYIDGHIKLTQSGAILRYVARKNNLLGITEEERYRADMFECIICDFRSDFIKLSYNSTDYVS